SGSPDVYYVGIGSTVYVSSTTAPTDAGTYEASASFADDGNHTTSSDSQDFTIAEAGTTRTEERRVGITSGSGTYDGGPNGAKAGGLTCASAVGSGSPDVYYVGIGSTVYVSSTTAPTDAGTYEASASFADDGNHTTSSDSQDFTIAEAGTT